MSRRQIAAIVALIAAPATLVFAGIVAVETFPRDLIVLGCVAMAIAAGLFGVVHRGVRRAAGLGVAVLALAGATVLLLAQDHVLDEVLLVVGLLVSLGAARVALTLRKPLPSVPAPRRPVLFFNPKSGGGKAERFALADEARARGIEAKELGPKDDLEALVREAVAGGADALAMAGGDGSQAIVASIAAELDLPYACVAAGTRNHFALDLGVDRDDVPAGLDAFVDGAERRVDLAEVNGRVFVNNVSLGVYGEAVQRSEYRGAKIRTLLETAPEVLGPGAETLDLRWSGPDGVEHPTAAAILVSNNRYRTRRSTDKGSRGTISDGLLGMSVVAAPPDRAHDERPPQPLSQWGAPSFEVQSDRPVAAGIDGEAVTLDPPLRFGVRRGVLRVRISRAHPGSAPPAEVPEGLSAGARALGRTAIGRAPGLSA